jgi:hypothetical protein
MMRVGDLISSPMWFARRKVWHEKRIGLIVNKFDSVGDVGELYKPGVQFEIMWRDTNECQWYPADVLDITASRVKVISEGR